MFRVLTKIGATISDITKQTERLDEANALIEFNAGDCIYLGSRIKFNHAYFVVETPATLSSIDKVEVWNGKEFYPVADKLDWTSGLLESGVIQFTPNKAQSGWQKADTKDISELNDFEIYGLNWLKITLKNTDSVSLGYIGHKFSDDVDLFGEFAALRGSEYLSYFGSTNYDAQHIIAGEIIEDKLIQMGSIDGIEQVLTGYDLRRASVSKVAEIVYRNCGNEYAELADSIAKEFASRISSAFPVVDKNGNATIDGNSRISTGRLYR